MAKTHILPCQVSVYFFKIIFCPTSWFILKQLDNFALVIYEQILTRMRLVDYLLIDNLGSLSNWL